MNKSFSFVSLQATHSPVLRTLISLILLTTMVFSSGCALWKKDEVDTEQLSAEVLYGEAVEAQQKENWAEAITAYERLEARYPYGRFAKQAQLATAYARYKLGDDGRAIAAADRFISLNPTHAAVDYAYYIKGLASFKEVSGIKGFLTGRANLADRDPQSLNDALVAFKTVVQRFPESRYAVDARKRISYLDSARAQHTIGIALFYYQRGAYIAAINRSKEILAEFGDLPFAEDALGIMYHSYQKMQMDDLASDSKRVLTLNYPDSGYLKTNTAIRSKFDFLSQLFKS